jgi:hypothetical protein
MKTNAGRRPPRMLVLCLLPAFFTPLFSQTLSGRFTYHLDNKKTDILLHELFDMDMQAQAVKTFFGNTYDQELVDLVFAIDERKTAGEPLFRLLKHGKSRGHLFGERSVYVMAFIATDNTDKGSIMHKAAEKGCPKAENADSCISVHLAPLDQQIESGEFAVFSIIKDVVSMLKGIPLANMSEPEASKIIDDTAKVVLLGENDSTRLYYACLKLPLKNNTVNRLRLGRMEDKWVYQTTFGNYSASWVTSSMGFLASRPKDSHSGSADSTDVRDPAFTPCLFAHVYLSRPLNPHPRYNSASREFFPRISFSVVLGTNLSGSFGDDLFVGGCIGHAISRLGILAGINYKNINYYKRSNKTLARVRREPQYSFGLSFLF